jgi:ATP-dependent RNA helicase DeaD
MLGRARVNAVWGDPPTADEIRALDRERLLQDPVLTDTPGDEDYALGDTMLEKHGVREIAAALAKVLRAKLPPPEEIEVEAQWQQRPRHEKERGPRNEGRPERESRAHDGPRADKPHRERPARDEGAPRHDKPYRERTARDEGAPRPARNTETFDGVWFRINVGRERNADPKWLLPEICRQGDVTKKDVGAIRVEEIQTLVQIATAAADAFAEKVAARTKGGVRITPFNPLAQAASPAEAPAPAAPERPEHAPGQKPFHDKGGFKGKGAKGGKPPFKPWNKGPGAKLKKGGKPPYKGGKPSGG